MRLHPVATIAATVGLLLGTTSASASSEHFNPPKHYYLALGDSLAYGYQYAKFLAEFPNIDATSFDTGYVDDLAARLRTVRPGIQTVNYGCPAETMVMAYYDPYAAVAPQSIAITGALNHAITIAAAAHGARVADAFTPINLAQPQPATLCALTLFCTALHDVHASDAGYAVIAQQFWAASGYSRLGD